MAAGRTVRVAAEFDVATAARAARELAEACGLTGVEAQHVATAVSEVASNAVKYAGGGQVELDPAERGGRRGLRVVVRDHGPGIADVTAALRDGVSTGGSLGLGLPGARRLMDDFTIRSGAHGTEIAMSRWEGGLLAGSAPAVCAVHEGQGGVGLAQSFRNGLLVGIAAGPRAGDVARDWRTRPWHAPSQLAEGARAILDPGQRLGLAVAAVSALDGRLAWLRAGAVSCVLLRGDSERSGEAIAGGEASGRDRKASGRGRFVLFPPAATALSRSGGGPLRAATIDVRRDDVLVLSALPLAPGQLAELAQRGSEAPDAPAFVTARFERGALEPRRPPGVERRSTLEGP